MKNVLLVAIVFFMSANSWGQGRQSLFLFQSVMNLDSFVTVPYEAKIPVLVVSIGADCEGECLKKAIYQVSDFSKYRGRVRLVISLSDSIWRNAKKRIQGVSLPQDVRQDIYHDPAGRFRTALNLGGSSAPVAVLFDSQGKRIWSETVAYQISPDSVLRRLGGK